MCKGRATGIAVHCVGTGVGDQIGAIQTGSRLGVPPIGLTLCEMPPMRQEWRF